MGGYLRLKLHAHVVVDYADMPIFNFVINIFQPIQMVPAQVESFERYTDSIPNDNIPNVINPNNIIPNEISIDNTIPNVT